MYERNWQRTIVAGKPYRRPRHSRPPCGSCPKCAGQQKQTSEVGEASELSKKNETILQLYHEYQSSGGMVDCPYLRRRFGFIRQIERGHERQWQRGMIEVMGGGGE